MHPPVRLVEGATENDMSEQTIWISGKLRGHADDGTPAWDLQGVFDTEAAADAACVDGADFIGPVPLNKPLPQDATSWPGCRYPRATLEEWIAHDQARKRREAEQTPDERFVYGDGRTA